MLLSGDADRHRALGRRSALLTMGEQLQQPVDALAGLGRMPEPAGGVDISGWPVLIGSGAGPARVRPRLVNVAPCVERLAKRLTTP